MMSDTKFMSWFLMTLLSTFITFIDSASSPNIIFIVMDDWGYADISARGAEFNTPYLDQLYQDSIVLNHHYIGLVCSPSRAQMLTGRYAWNFGFSSQTPFSPAGISTFPTGFPTIGNLLSQYTEYKSYVTGKWHLGFSTNEHVPLSRGFDEFYGFYSTGIFYSNKTRDYSNAGLKYQYIDWRKNWEVDYETQYEYSTFVTRDRILEIIANHSKSTHRFRSHLPFFVFAPFQAPHADLQDVTSSNSDNCNSISQMTEMSRNKGDLDASSATEKRYKYCLNAMAVDDSIGAIMESLETNELWDNTLIIFTSDNGNVFCFLFLHV